MYISSGVSFVFGFSFDLPIEVILSALLFTIKSPVASAGFYTTFLDAAFAASIPVLVAVSINFCTIFITKVSSKRQNTITVNAFSKSWFS